MLAAMNAMLGLSRCCRPCPAHRCPRGLPPNPFCWSYMGVRVQNAVDGNDAPLQISAPEPGTPAYRAGLQVGDVLVRIGNHQPQTFEDVQRHVFGLRPGTVVSVEVRRGSETKVLRMTLAERPTTPDYQVLPSFIRQATPPRPDNE